MFCTKSLSADLTASGSISATDTVCSILDGDRDRACVGLRLRERGVPTWGIGLPRPSVVVAYVFSKPLVGELGLDLRGLTLLFRNGLRDLGASCRKPIVRLKLEWILESLNSMSLFAPSTRASWASSAFTRPSAPLSFSFKSYKSELQFTSLYRQESGRLLSICNQNVPLLVQVPSLLHSQYVVRLNPVPW